MYFGEYERTVDYKGRLTVPAHLLVAAEAGDWGRVMVLSGEPQCLYVYDLETWRTVLEKARESMADDDEGRLFMHRRLSDAQLSDVDNLKRITLPAPLLERAGIDKKAVVLGMFDRLEIWSPDIWAAYVESLGEVPVPSLSDLARARIRQVS